MSGSSTAKQPDLVRGLVDGSMSTNDTVLVLASGRSGVDGTDHSVAFTDALTEVCGSLAEQMARDAEGATKFVRVQVAGARTADDARIAARAVANRPAAMPSTASTNRRIEPVIMASFGAVSPAIRSRRPRRARYTPRMPTAGRAQTKKPLELAAAGRPGAFSRRSLGENCGCGPDCLSRSFS